MQKKSKNVLINLILIVTVFFLLWTGYVGFAGGPAQVYKEEDRLFMDAIADYKDLDSARLINRYALDNIYYIIESETNGIFEIAWFDKDFKNYKTYQDVEMERVYPLAKELGIEQDKVSYGVVNQDLVYVLKDAEYNEIFIDVQSLKEVRVGVE